MATVLRRSSRRAILGTLLCASLLASACAPNCERVCNKARRCDLAPRLSQAECVESCDRQRLYYDIQDDKARLEAFAAHRRCIANASCEEIQDGVCYDEQIFPF